MLPTVCTLLWRGEQTVKEMGWPVSQTSLLDRSADRSLLGVACVTLPRPSGLLLVESKRKVEHATAVTFSMKEEAVFLCRSAWLIQTVCPLPFFRRLLRLTRQGRWQAPPCCGLWVEFAWRKLFIVEVNIMCAYWEPVVCASHYLWHVTTAQPNATEWAELPWRRWPDLI